MTNVRIRDILFIVVCITLCEEVRGHGRLIEPPSRSSMWRQGYSNPRNYNDNELNCGGSKYQYTVANGKCGTCGDPYKSGQRNNEAGGKYANDIVVRTYKQGQTIPIVVQITSQHGGWFEIRICPIEVDSRGKGQKVSLRCLDKNILRRSDGSGRRTYMKQDARTGMLEIDVVLPSDLVCERCVIQWKWNAGSGKGKSRRGREREQLQFYGCADVKIERGSRGDEVTKEAESTTISSTLTILSSAKIVDDANNSKSTVTKKYESTSNTAQIETIKIRDRSDCRSTTKFKKYNLDSWCKINCALGNCPSSHCECGEKIKKQKRICKTTTTGPFRIKKLDSWCKLNCQLGYCPKTHCECKAMCYPHVVVKARRKYKKCKTNNKGQLKKK